MKQFTSKTQKIGRIGESLAARKLLTLGFEILERNYTKPLGEIDIVAKRGSGLHFVEVKSVSRENLERVSGETNTGIHYRPEENLTFSKFLKIAKTVDVYLSEHGVSPETPWQIDLALVYIDTNKRQGKVEILENIVF